MSFRQKMNILDTIPVYHKSIRAEWQGGNIVLSLSRFKHNWMKRLFLFTGLSPYIHICLEEHGTAVWQLIDGKRNVREIIDLLTSHFSPGEEYASRVVLYIRQLHKDGFIHLCQP